MGKTYEIIDHKYEVIVVGAGGAAVTAASAIPSALTHSKTPRSPHALGRLHALPPDRISGPDGESISSRGRTQPKD